MLDGTKVEGSLIWTFDSGNEAFRYLKAGEQLLLEYALVADDGNGGTEQTTLQLVISGTNDLPTIQGVPVSREAVTVGIPATLAHINVQDVDATELTVSLTAENGQIGGLSGWTKADSVWSKTATADVLNAALANATFIATRKGDASIEVSVTDETGTAVKTVYDLKAKSPVVNPTVEVDGVGVTYSDAWLPTGDLGRQVDIPVITAGRTEQTGAANVADIPLVKTGNALLLSAQLPIGFGLKALGGNVSTAANSLANLIESIKAVSAVNSHDLEHLTSNGSAFLAGLSGDSALLVQTLTPVATGNAAPSAPLVINGSIHANQHTALVIDASSLPAGSTLQLNNVDFASVVGAVTVIGSKTGQMFSGDGESQTFVLAGNSGSQAYAGGGNDTIAVNAAAPGGSASSSLVHGGSGADTLAFSGARSDYVIEQRDGSVVVSRVDAPSQQTMLINVESLQFSDGNIGVESRSELGLIAGLYHNILSRQADLDGFEYWGLQQSSGSQSLGQIALSMIASSENFAAGHGFTNDIGIDLEVLYRSLFNRDADADGKAYWTGQMQGGMSLQDVANSMVGSIEMSANTQRVGEWDFTI
ncbi:DUF4214 domain-containing protein [Pseudomonas sp. PS01300]|uniref:DUF4214 domain-containing protein n=1 Tax=Pseudomonas sp. PS01300 TaxID=2991436 RepID=UPI00249C9AC3|nr:DUF4214 domain-containing protein [Pseudomonas sp. PS01300]